jgi:RNA polymerase sigma factor (sigma-70 family)
MAESFRPPSSDQESRMARLEALLIACAPAVCDYLDRKTPSSLRSLISTDDILQEVYKGVIQVAEGLECNDPASFTRLLIHHADCRLVDAIRGARAIRRGGKVRLIRANHDYKTSMAILFSRLTSREPTPSRVVSFQEAATAVEEALRDLPEDQRQALMLHDFEGCPPPEIAQRMNRTVASIRSLVFRARKMLRQRLGHREKYLSGDAPLDHSDAGDEPMAADRTVA